jgi:polyisoprenoid-binding protein YceI
MNSLIVFGIAGVLLPAAFGAEYRIAPAAGSRMELQVEKTGFLRGKKHVFLFEKYEGTLQYHPEKPESSTVRLRIDAGSISCKDTWLSAKDLVKVQKYALEEMLAAERYAYIEFASTEIRSTGPGQFQAAGMLTIRGIGKPATVAVNAKEHEASLELIGSAVVRLPDYGLKPPTAALGTIGTKPDMAFSFTLTAARAKNTSD